ncbi:MAG: FAD-dependent oxidoreductase [Saprospiraceae bacterium]|nr:FAD-dependent oxidoreductase [Saprospiraceae bacterium]MDW8484995.1 FAD-dependent oxidoreductase [Saprospiraceae bacterium]
MPTLWYESLVVRIEQATPTVRRFWLSTPSVQRPPFKAGQFITFDLPIGEKRLHRWRSYSIASAPEDDPDLLELCIVRVPDGLATRYLFEEVKEGSVLRWKGPEGTFCLPDTLEDKDLVMVCTGTGVAPFRSMLRHLHHTGQPHRNLHLIFGTRTEQDILYRREFEELTRIMPQFRYDIALSRQPNWPGYRGYVHQIYLEHYAQKRPDVLFYLCGWSNMIDEAVANLLVKLGYDRKQILYELYG